MKEGEQPVSMSQMAAPKASVTHMPPEVGGCQCWQAGFVSPALHLVFKWGYYGMYA